MMIFDFFREKLATFGPFFPDFPISQNSREFPGLAKMGLGFPGLKKRGKYSTLLNSNASPAPFVAKENPTASVPQKTVPFSFPMTPMTLPMSVANHLMAAAALNVPFQTVSNQESASIPMVPLGSINSM